MAQLKDSTLLLSLEDINQLATLTLISPKLVLAYLRTLLDNAESTYNGGPDKFEEFYQTQLNAVLAFIEMIEPQNNKKDEGHDEYRIKNLFTSVKAQILKTLRA